MIKEGVDKIGEKPRKVTYKDVAYDKNGWALPDQYLPIDYDLLLVKIAGKKSTSAWVCGKKWFGLRLDPSDVVVAWKRKPQEE